MNKKIWWTIIVILLISVVYYWFFYEKPKDIPNEPISESESRQKEILSKFIEKYQPNTDIKSGLSYTFQLEDELINKNKPIIFTGSLDDIFRKNGEFYLRFNPHYLEFDKPFIFYTLKGCGDKVENLINDEYKIFRKYIVVAKIENIEKPIFGVTGYSYNVEDSVELELSESSTFIATGACIDLDYIEESPI